MNTILLLVLIVLTILMSMNNIKRLKQYRKDKTYIDIYTKILRDTDGAYDELVNYIGSENDACLKTKSELIKLYEDIKDDKDLSEFDEIDFVKDIFYDGEVFSKDRVTLNSEVFIWFILILSRARNLSMMDVMDNLYNKVSKYEENLNTYIEYQVFKASYNVLLEKNEDGVSFLKKLLNGEYTEYTYDKNLIGIYKKIAACLLCYAGEIVEESDEDLIKDFTTTLIGNRFTKDLGIYEKYSPMVEDEKNVEETAEEPAKELEETSESVKEETDGKEE